MEEHIGEHVGVLGFPHGFRQVHAFVAIQPEHHLFLGLQFDRQRLADGHPLDIIRRHQPRAGRRGLAVEPGPALAAIREPVE